MPFAERALCIATAISAMLAMTAVAAADPPFKDFNPDSPKIDLPGLSEYAPVTHDPGPAAGLRSVRVEAKLTLKGNPLDRGLVWRVFYPTPGSDGKLPLLATSTGGSATFQFQPGEYLVNVVFGRASATKKLIVPRNGPMPHQLFILNAGGLVLNAVAGDDLKIPPDKLKFSIYTKDEDGKRHLVMAKVKPNTIVRLKAGTYHVVSDYGKVNAVIGADIRVEAGKMTEATIQHRAAQLTLKLVSGSGGEAIADTAWSILTPAGDIVSESVGAFPTVVLAEGKYTAVARNKGHIYQRDFAVAPGHNQDVEVLLTQEVEAAGEDAE